MSIQILKFLPLANINDVDIRVGSPKRCVLAHVSLRRTPIAILIANSNPGDRRAGFCGDNLSR